MIMNWCEKGSELFAVETGMFPIKIELLGIDDQHSHVTVAYLVTDASGATWNLECEFYVNDNWSAIAWEEEEEIS